MLEGPTDFKKIEEFSKTIENDMKVFDDPELVDVDPYKKLKDEFSIKSKLSYIEKKDQCYRILEKLNEGQFKYEQIETNQEKHNDDSQFGHADLTSTINYQKYSVSYASNFQSASVQENIIVAETEIRAKEIYETTISKDTKPADNTEDSQEIKFKSFTTISDAILDASPGQTIWVDNGVYHESLMIHKSVEIRAIEDKKVKIISQSGDCVTLNASCGRLDGLVLYCDTPGNSFCTRTLTGILELEKCYLDSNAAGCVRVERGARLTATGCQMNSLNGSSTSLEPDSRTVLVECTFTQIVPEELKKEFTCTRHEALIVDSEATCILINCQQIQYPIIFNNNSRGMLDNCSISVQEGSKGSGFGVIIRDGATPLIRNCDIHHCKESGIYFQTNSKGVVSGCKIHHNLMFGVQAMAAEQFLLINNEISENFDYGVRVTNGSKGDIKNTRIIRNKGGVFVEQEIDLVLKDCSIENNFYQGFYFKAPDQMSTVPKKTVVTLYNTSVKWHLIHPAFQLTGNCELNLIRSKIKFNKIGICLLSDSIANLRDSSTIYNFDIHVLLHDNSKVFASGTTFTVFETAGVVLKNNSEGQFTNCTFDNGSEITKLTAKFAKEKPGFIENLNNQIQFRISVIQKSDCTEDTRKKEGKLHQEFNAMKNEPERPENQKPGMRAIYLCDDSTTKIDNCNFRKNNFSIVVKNNARALQVVNSNFDVDMQSIHVIDNGYVDISNSRFHNSKNGLKLENEASATVRNGTIFDNCEKWAIIMSNKSKLNFFGSFIHQNKSTLVAMDDNAEAKFEQSTLRGFDINQNQIALSAIDLNQYKSLDLRKGQPSPKPTEPHKCKLTLYKCQVLCFNDRAINAADSAVIIQENTFSINSYSYITCHKSEVQILSNYFLNPNNPEFRNAISLFNCTGMVKMNYYSLNKAQFLSCNDKYVVQENNVFVP